MNEKLLQFIWKNRLLVLSDFTTLQGNQAKLISPGTINDDAGADFQNARLVLDGITWAGNIEIDLQSSNWYAHGHHADPSHENTILHVVYENDLPHEKLKVPLLELKPLISPDLFSRYEVLMQSLAPLHCRSFISQLKDFTVTSWLERMAVERMEYKYQRIKSLLEANRYNWEETFYVLLCRSFGFNLNADAFEQLAHTLTFRLLSKAKGHPDNEEAVLLGAAGFLKDANDEYSRSLLKQYSFFARAYKISSMSTSVWKFAKTRPANFPTIRVAQLASLYKQYPQLFSLCLDAEDVSELYPVFEKAEAGNYWKTHYRFRTKTAHKFTRIGRQSINGILINTVIPVIFSYGKHTGDIALVQRAIRMLGGVESEDNKFTRIFTDLQLPNRDAMQSQGYFHLYNQYCKPKRCLDCGIGLRLLKNM